MRTSSITGRPHSSSWYARYSGVLPAQGQRRRPSVPRTIAIPLGSLIADRLGRSSPAGPRLTVLDGLEHDPGRLRVRAARRWALAGDRPIPVDDLVAAATAGVLRRHAGEAGRLQGVLRLLEVEAGEVRQRPGPGPVGGGRRTRIAVGQHPEHDPGTGWRLRAGRRVLRDHDPVPVPDLVAAPAGGVLRAEVVVPGGFGLVLGQLEVH